MTEPMTMPITQRALPDWSSLGFAFVETDAMYQCRGNVDRTPVWGPDRFSPVGTIELSPAAAFLSYGQGIFEGLKAQRTEDGRILLFRPDANGHRFQSSAERLSMPAFPVDRFVEMVHQIVARNARWVPPSENGSLYVRPTQHAVEARLGLGVCREFTVASFVSPVGPYFKGDDPAVKLRVLEQGRVAPGGTGAAKAMGNYAGAIWVAAQWKSQGYDDVLYLDARHQRFVTETSGSNPFVRLRSGQLVTPPLDDQVLAGVTRDSTIRLAREKLGLEVEERPLPIEEVLADGVELFCTGTAWTLLSVEQIDTPDTQHRFASTETRDALFELLHGIQTGEREDPFGWIQEVVV